MTPEERRDYLEDIRKRKGAGLNGLELPTFRKAMEASEAGEKARTELQRVTSTVRQLEQVIQQCDGRTAACFELLLAVEEERRGGQPSEHVAQQLTVEDNE